jgi:homoserine dehydrogenase
MLVASPASHVPPAVARQPFLARPRRALPDVRVGLLGLGQVGSAVARLARARPVCGDMRVAIAGALVRDTHRPRLETGVAVTTDARDIFAAEPSVIVEALGGLEPARTLVLQAIARGVPVVTANKSLIAHHGDEVLTAAARAGVPVLFEAAVVAGVPFLNAFARRPHAAAVSRLSGIVNGTTNFILTQLQDGQQDYAGALALAQELGFAEPDPSKDVDGVDAAEKLAILIRVFAGRRIAPTALETTGIAGLSRDDLRAARALGGTLKPVVHASSLASGDTPAAFIGPAFVPDEHPLARLRLQTNGVCLEDAAGSCVTFSGPGAGPDVTAVTVLDDAIEAATGATPFRWPEAVDAEPAAPATQWFVRVSSAGDLTACAQVVELLATCGVAAARMALSDEVGRASSTSFITQACERADIARATTALAAATGASTRTFRALTTL